MLHVVPFQCSISPPEAPVPAAHASVLVRAEAPSSDTLFPVDGMVTAVHPGAAIAGAAITSAPVSAAAPAHFARRNIISPSPRRNPLRIPGSARASSNCLNLL